MANLEGSTGISIGRVESADNSRQDLIIDTQTGALIGERRVELTDEGWGYPAGTTTGFTAVRTSVVDSVPEGGTQNGQFDREGCTEMGRGTSSAERGRRGQAGGAVAGGHVRGGGAAGRGTYSRDTGRRPRDDWKRTR